MSQILMRLVLIRADVKRVLYRGKEGAGVGPWDFGSIAIGTVRSTVRIERRTNQ